MKTNHVTLTPIEEQLLFCVNSFIKKHRYAPSQRQLQTALKYKSVKSVQQLVAQLVKKKLVEYDPGVPRSMRLVNGREGRKA